MVLGGVVGHEIHNELQAQSMGFVAHPIKVLKSAEPRVDGAVIGHVVPGVVLWRQVERGQPHRIHAQLFEVGQFFGHTAQVAHPVSVGVLEGARIHLVDHGVPPPLGTGLLTWGHCFFRHSLTLVSMRGAGEISGEGIAAMKPQGLWAVHPEPLTTVERSLLLQQHLGAPGSTPAVTGFNALDILRTPVGHTDHWVQESCFSAMETLTRMIALHEGLPPPQLNYPVKVNGRTFYLDLAWPETEVD